MILLLILIVAVGAGLSAAFTSPFWRIAVIIIGLLCAPSVFRQRAIDTRMKELAESIQSDSEAWAAQDARWDKQHPEIAAEIRMQRAREDRDRRAAQDAAEAWLYH